MSRIMLPMPKSVSFQEITRILEMTDLLDLDREFIEIPLSTQSPGQIHKLPNGKIEIIVDGDLAFQDWLVAAEHQLRQLVGFPNE
jgi:hypothetical protein